MGTNLFMRCKLLLIFSADVTVRPTDPCNPSPCGLQSQCRIRNGLPSCANLPVTADSLECISNNECGSREACINRRCSDPCPGSCGLNTECRVFSNTPMCLCNAGFTGDPFIRCTPIQSEFIPYIYTFIELSNSITCIIFLIPKIRVGTLCIIS